MNDKYSFGYFAMGVLSLFGALAIAASIFLAIKLAAGENSGSGMVAAAVFFVGSAQGLIVIGLGSIGGALLDGSVAQQELLLLAKDNPTGVDPLATSQENLLRYLVAASLGTPGTKFIEVYKGVAIFETTSGGFTVGSQKYTDVHWARKAIDSGKLAETLKEQMKLDADGAVIFLGYRVPLKDGKYVLSGRGYDTAEGASEAIYDAVETGATWNLGSYKIKT